jgi:hypothetical protein
MLLKVDEMILYPSVSLQLNYCLTSLAIETIIQTGWFSFQHLSHSNNLTQTYLSLFAPSEETIDLSSFPLTSEIIIRIT